MALPVGTIVLWSGSIANIPDAFKLCDGSSGTPDLRDRFVPGAGGVLDPGDTGGAQNHTHTFTGDGHNHGIPVGAVIQSGPGFANLTNVEPSTGTTDLQDGRPPYYSLAYIMFTG